MRRIPLLVVAILALTAAPLPTHAGKDAGDYLTADGHLKEALEIKDLQGGFAGFTGWLWKVEKNGQWQKFQVGPQNKLTEKEAGKLDKDQLQKLAKELAKYELSGLNDSGKASVNPHVITVTFGKLQAKHTSMAGVVPAPDAAEVPGRFGGILQAVKTSLKGKPGEEK